MNIDFAKVCGKHSAIFEAYYKQIDPKGSGAIEAMTAAKFLKKSGLSDVVLSRVWDLSDPNGKGFLDKPGFFIALKLVSLAQAGQVINMTNIYAETANPPKVGDIPKIIPQRVQPVPVASGGVPSGDWSISVMDRLKYEDLFNKLNPVGGMLPGNKVKNVLMDSKLPMETLGKIWDLADQDKDGNLDKHEFLVAMHLVYQTLDKRIVPDVLPPELCKGGPPPPKPAPPVVHAMPRAPSGEGFGDGGFVANFPKDIAPPPVVPPPPAAMRVPPVGSTQPLISTDPLISIGGPPTATAHADWVVTPADMKRYEVMFRDSDRDKDGLVSGLEVKNVFLQSGVAQNCLAHIWSLCDTNQSGKLTLEQFALAMWMVERKQKGLEPPQVLTANMVPPSLRGIAPCVDLQPQVEAKPTYSNPELDMIAKEIEELAQERRAMETEIAQKEADIRIKSGEVRCLQSELDTLSATLKQLENQRGEAQKRLDDLKAQSIEYGDALANLKLELSDTNNKVNKIRDQCQKQEDTINEQEGELNAKRSELQKLKDEEAALQKEYDDNNKELMKLTQHLQNTQLQISSVRSMVTQLMETQRQMTDALLMCRAAIESHDGELVSEYQLKIEPDFDDARKTLEKKLDEPKVDPFAANETSTTNGFATNGFGSSDPFGGVATTAPARGGFDDSFNNPTDFGSGFDAFGNSSAFAPPHDPFGGDAFAASKINAVTPEPGKDDFGSDPFAALHAPTGQGQVLSPNPQKSGPPPRPESPSPALPPKKSKVPPPRPAPPRPVQGPPRPTQPATDAFGASSTSGGFADFADFDNKLHKISPPPQMTLLTSASLSSLVPATTAQTLGGSNSLFDVSTITTHTANSFAFMPPLTSATTTASISTISTTTTTTQTTGNTLTRSITPLQQAASVFAPTSVSANMKSHAAPAVSGPTDFSDDPFKDYRYEDPFSIKDPFDDDGLDVPAPEKIFKDDLSSEDEQQSLPTNNNVKSSDDPQELLDDFASLKMAGAVASQSIAPSAFSVASTLPKAPSPKPSVAATAKAATGGLFDDFADFDAFGTKAFDADNNALNNNNNQKATTAKPGTDKPNNNYFFDAFNDSFNANTDARSPFALTKNAFDAFGGTKNTVDAFAAFPPPPPATSVIKSAKVFDDDNFGDNFFGAQTTPNSNINFSATTEKKTAPSDGFAKFDAFSDGDDFGSDFNTALNNSINLTKTGLDLATTSSARNATNATKLAKVPNSKTANSATDNGAKLPEKFAADYSQGDSFDKDLEEALRRSMIDQ